jgi:hypothetical protein
VKLPPGAMQDELTRTIEFVREERIAALELLSEERIAAVKDMQVMMANEHEALVDDAGKISLRVVDHAFWRVA